MGEGDEGRGECGQPGRKGISKRRIGFAVLVLLLVVGVAGLLWAARGRLQNRLTVENRSGQAIALLRVTTGGETAVFRDLPDGAAATAPFRIQTDDHFAVEGRLEDGTGLGGNFGYVTNGMSGQRARFVVLPGGKIRFDQSNRIGPY